MMRSDKLRRVKRLVLTGLSNKKGDLWFSGLSILETRALKDVRTIWFLNITKLEITALIVRSIASVNSADSEDREIDQVAG